MAGNVNKWFGVAGDVSGGYATVNGVSTRTYTYTGGPVFSYRNNEKLTPFAHALFGGFHASAGVSGLSTSTNGFAMQFGGGADLKLSDRIAWRLAQVDWMLLHSQGETLNKNVRISTGIVFRF